MSVALLHKLILSFSKITYFNILVVEDEDSILYLFYILNPRLGLLNPRLPSNVENIDID